MGIVIRQSFKSTLVQYVGVILGYMNVVFIFPKCLPLDEIGLVRFLLEMGLFLAFFAQIGIPNAINRFYPYFKDEKNNDKGFQFFIFVLPVAGFLLFSILFVLTKPLFIDSFRENSPLVIRYFWYFLPFTLVFTYLSITEVYCSALFRIVVPKIIKDIYLRAGTSVILLMKYFNWISFDIMLNMIVGLYAFGVVINFLYIYQLKGINLKPDFSMLSDSSLVRHILFFLGYIMIAGMGSTLVNRIDSYMISSLIDLPSFSVYSTALFMAIVIELPYRAINQISAPIISDAMKNENMTLVNDMYKKSAINQLIIGVFIFLVVWINIDDLFAIMPKGDVFKAGKYVFLFIGLSKIFDLLTGINVLIMTYSKYYYYGLYFVLLLAVMAVINNLLLIPPYGIVGVGIATAISIFLYNLIIVTFVKVKHHTHPFTIKTVFILLIGTGFFFINMILPHLTNPYADAIYRSAIIAPLYLLVIFSLKLSPEINNTAKVLLKRLKLIRDPGDRN